MKTLQNKNNLIKTIMRQTNEDNGRPEYLNLIQPNLKLKHWICWKQDFWTIANQNKYFILTHGNVVEFITGSCYIC